MRALLKRFDVRVSVVYGLVATLWIIASDALVISVLESQLALLDRAAPD